MQFDQLSLKDNGFTGFRSVASLEINRIPQHQGIFVLVAPKNFEPRYLNRSTAGVFKKKNPSLKSEQLAAEWVAGAEVLYIGKASPGSQGNRGLRRQIQEFVDFGNGKPPGHWDGRLIWQLKGAGKLLVAWKEMPPEELNPTLASYHSSFREQYGKLPFANLVHAR
ncbi:hypothetical protein [Glutamicibacter sp. JC586]|uniref:hypothetical protein n=1 Tax=Glutamicibacter sp. JC586 TaxID=2590552 RepID=UPI0013597058|nr:hypothetical protein [Glutamicibacter sp. JC586]